MKKIVVLLFMTMMLLVTSLSANAYSFEVDGIYYNIISSSDMTVAVAPKDDSNWQHQPYSNANAYSDSVNIPNIVTFLTKTYTVTAVADRAFIHCDKLTNVVLPSSLKTIGEDAFYGCTNLKKLHIPKSVTSIKTYKDNYYSVESCFSGCSNLDEISVEEGNPIYDSRNNCNALIKTKTNELILCTSSTIEIPKTVKKIGSSAFLDNKRLTKLSIHSNITSISSNAFRGCSGLAELRIEDGLELLYISGCLPQKYSVKGMFSGCPIKKLYLGRPIQHVWEGGFGTDSPGILFNSKLENITIGASVNELGPTSDKFFSYSEKIIQIDCLNSNPPEGFYCPSAVYFNAKLNIPKGTLKAYQTHLTWGKFKNIFEIHSPSITKHDLSYDVFEYNDNDLTCKLINTIGAGDISINRLYEEFINGYKFVSVGDGKKALNGTLSISLPASIQSINDYSLSKIRGGSDYNQNEKDYKIQIPIENELKYIGAYAFPADPFDKFRLHINKDCEVNLYAFATNGSIINNCSNLTIDSENPYIGLEEGVLYYKGDSEDVVRYFVHQTPSDTVLIPDRFTTIDNISTTTSLENVKFENVSAVEYLRLKNCNIVNDEELCFEGIDTISNEMFKNCKFNTKKLEFSNAKYVSDALVGNFKHLVFKNVETLVTGSLFAGTADTLSVHTMKFLDAKFIAQASIGRLNWLNKEVPFAESIENFANKIEVLNLCDAKSIGYTGLMYAMKNRAMSILLSTPTPPEVLSIVLYDDYPSKVKLYVPAGSGEAYRNHEKWGVIPTIIEYDVNGPDPTTSGIESAVADEADAVVDVYNLQGVRVRNGVQRSEATQDLPQGIYIIDGEKVIVK